MNELLNDDQRFETIYGFDIKELAVIASALRAAHIPPARVSELVRDTQRFLEVCWEMEKEIIKDNIRQAFAGVYGNEKKQTEEAKE